MSQSMLDLSDPVLRCLAIPKGAIAPGEMTADHLERWLNVERLHYTENLQWLETGFGGEQLPALTQHLEPAPKGSTRSQFKSPLEGSRTYRLYQKIFLQPDFDWGGEREGGKLGFGLAGGTAPTGGEVDPYGFSARFMWRGNGDGSARAVVYSYAADRTQNLPYGDDYPLFGINLPTGEWFELVLQITANSSADVADGQMIAWYNGVEMLNESGIQWQTAGSTPVIDSISYSTFYGGGNRSWSPAGHNYIQFADICWSNKPN